MTIKNFMSLQEKISNSYNLINKYSVELEERKQTEKSEHSQLVIDALLSFLFDLRKNVQWLENIVLEKSILKKELSASERFDLLHVMINYIESFESPEKRFLSNKKFESIGFASASDLLEEFIGKERIEKLYKSINDILIVLLNGKK